MHTRWKVLALLFGVRLSMAFQFQSAASLSPAIMKEYGVGIGDIGLLISLYLAPGLAFAIPGGQIGRRFGDKQVVLFGLLLMVAGGLIMAFAPRWGWQLTGRVLAGAGGVLLNVLMSKMVTDWFAGREIATAMAIFVNSWPAGIALCLIIMPAVLSISGICTSFLVSTALCAGGFIAFAILYCSPPQPILSTAHVRASWPAVPALKAVVVAGCIWGLFNASLGMVFGFGSTFLMERGWSLAAAGSATSLVLWVATISVPLGGLLADRTGKPTELMLMGFVLFAAALTIATRTDAVIPAFVALGLVGGISAGPIMSLPARVLSPSVRAVGMGVYLTLFYVFVILAPIVAGALATRSSTAQAAFDLGACMLAVCVPAYFVFNRFAGRSAVVPGGPEQSPVLK
jgi:MFS family permease